MASPKSTPPLLLHLHEWAQETTFAMRALERRTVRVTGKLPADHRTTAQMFAEADAEQEIPMQQLSPLLRRTVDQAILHTGKDGDRPGDCLRAAMATITDRALLEVPHFVETPGSVEDFWAEVRGYVHRVTLGTHMLECFDAWEWLERGGADLAHAVVLTGNSPRSINGEFSHAVVADPRTLEVLHDPHPSRAGVTTMSQVYALFPVAPVPA